MRRPERPTLFFFHNDLCEACAATQAADEPRRHAEAEVARNVARDAFEASIAKAKDRDAAILASHWGATLAEGSAVPDPLQARHVAVALLAWWLATPDATDRCYGVRISPQTCRGIANAPQEPEALP